MNRYRRLLSIPLALTLIVAAGLPVVAGSERATLERYARDTWASFVAMTDPATGLPSDNIGGDLDPATRSAYTSPTNIGMYIWATLAARDLKIIKPGEARARIGRTLTSVVANELRHDRLQGYFSRGDVQRALEPLMEMERFGAGRAAP